VYQFLLIKIIVKRLGACYMSKAVKYHKQGYNCAESILKSFNDENRLSIPVSIGTPFGSGMTVGSTCGAITGAMIAVGAVSGRETETVPNESRPYAKELMDKVKEKYGTYECRELKKQGVSCNEIICYMEQQLKELLPVIVMKKE
jgi:C_GCAxxG_C_C family probable redox protein